MLKLIHLHKPLNNLNLRLLRYIINIINKMFMLFPQHRFLLEPIDYQYPTSLQSVQDIRLQFFIKADL